MDCSSSSTTGAVDEDGSEVVDVRERRPGDDEVAEGLEEIIGLVAQQKGRRVELQRASALERVREDHRAGGIVGAVDAVRVAGQSGDAGRAVEGDGEAEQIFEVAAAAPVRIGDSDGRFAAREDQPTLAVIAEPASERGVAGAEIARFGLELVAEGGDNDAAGGGEPGGRGEGGAGPGDDSSLLAGTSAAGR